MMGAYRVLSGTLFYLGDFESSRQYAMRAVHIWRSGSVQSHPEDLDTPVVGCLCYQAKSEWHLGEIASSKATIAEAISVAKKLNDMHTLASALYSAAILGYYELKFADVERLASDLIELSTRHNFVYWLAAGATFRGWARSALGETAEGIAWIEQGIRDLRASGLTLDTPSLFALKAEALHLADRTSEALEAIREAEAMVERSEERFWCAELHRLRGVFCAALGAEDLRIAASLCEAIRIAKKQKSVSLEKRAEATYAEYRRQKSSPSGGCNFRLPLW
jgi:predicted ATPase